jgi:hypothetical protein
MSEFIREILSHFTSEALLALGVLVFGLLRRYKASFAPIAAYGFLGGIGVAVLIICFTGRPLFSPSPTDTSNIEGRIKAWAEMQGMAIQSMGVEKPAFQYRLTFVNGHVVDVMHDETKIPGYIQFHTQVFFPPEIGDAMRKLSIDDRKSVSEEVELELSRSDLEPTFLSGGGSPLLPVEYVDFGDTIPLDGFRRSDFSAEAEKFDNAILGASAAFPLAIKHASHGTALLSVHK